MLIRPIEPTDMEPLLTMLQTSGQFDNEGLEHVRETLKTYFSTGSEELCFSAEQQGFAGIAYCVPEAIANGVWNLLMLWISPPPSAPGIRSSLDKSDRDRVET